MVGLDKLQRLVVFVVYDRYRCGGDVLCVAFFFVAAGIVWWWCCYLRYRRRRRRRCRRSWVSTLT